MKNGNIGTFEITRNIYFGFVVDSAISGLSVVGIIMGLASHKNNISKKSGFMKNCSKEIGDAQNEFDLWMSNIQSKSQKIINNSEKQKQENVQLLITNSELSEAIYVLQNWMFSRKCVQQYYPKKKKYKKHCECQITVLRGKEGIR